MKAEGVEIRVLTECVQTQSPVRMHTSQPVNPAPSRPDARPTNCSNYSSGSQPVSLDWTSTVSIAQLSGWRPSLPHCLRFPAAILRLPWDTAPLSPQIVGIPDSSLVEFPGEEGHRPPQKSALNMFLCPHVFCFCDAVVLTSLT